ncbi:hypothetical protein CR513_58884, partial [Mucuna pruriens]
MNWRTYYQVRRIPERSTYGHLRRYQLQPSVVGYPMILLAPEEAIAPFVIHGMGAHSSEYFKRIRHAWKSIVKNGPEWGALSCGASFSYRTWLRGWVEQIRLSSDNPKFAKELEGTLKQIESEHKVLKIMLEVALVVQIAAQEEAD